MSASITKYSDLPIVTQTYVLYSNLKVNVSTLATVLPITMLQHPPLVKPRMQVNPEEDLADGSIVYIRYNQLERGKALTKSKQQMASCLNFIIKLDKYYNAKLSERGKLQITGCKKLETPLLIFKYLWKYLNENPEHWRFQENQSRLHCLMIPVMVNNNFSLGFCVDRGKLNNLALKETKYISMFEPSDSYVGANIKVARHFDDIENEVIYVFNDDFTLIPSKYQEYLDTLSPKEMKKRVEHQQWTTFMIFYNGKIILSGGLSERNRSKAYDDLISFILERKSEIVIHSSSSE